MGLTSKLKQGAQKAVDRIFSDEDRAKQLAGVIGKVQKGKEALERGQDELLRQLHLAPRADFKEIGKRLATLKRRIRELNKKLEKL